MAGHDIIVIGASSGGVEVLTTLVSGLPADLPAAVFIVLHVRPDAPSLLPSILGRVGVLPAAHAVDGEPIRTGRIYVAPPGRQMYIDKRRVSVEIGPRENMHRPAIDPLFRTAAEHHSTRVVGVVLSGALDDGTAGLQAIKDAGGVAVVQNPADATSRSMPAHAMERVAVDHCVNSVDLANLLTRLARQPADEPDARVQSGVAAMATAGQPFEHAAAVPIPGIDSGLTCPECSGVLREVRDRGVVRFRCRVGHAYTSQSMLEAQGDAVEKTLWTAVRMLEERSVLLHKLAANAGGRGHESVAGLFLDRSAAIDQDVRMLRDLMARGRALDPVTREMP